MSEFRRRADDYSFVKRNWQIIIIMATFIAGYSALTWSVGNHHEIDDKRDSSVQAIALANAREIVKLQEAFISLLRGQQEAQQNQVEMQRDIKELLKRVR